MFTSSLRVVSNWTSLFSSAASVSALLRTCPQRISQNVFIGHHTIERRKIALLKSHAPVVFHLRDVVFEKCDCVHSSIQCERVKRTKKVLCRGSEDEITAANAKRFFAVRLYCLTSMRHCCNALKQANFLYGCVRVVSDDALLCWQQPGPLGRPEHGPR